MNKTHLKTQLKTTFFSGRKRPGIEDSNCMRTSTIIIYVIPKAVLSLNCTPESIALPVVSSPGHFRPQSQFHSVVEN
jgi:hypothetical protein